MERNGQRSVNDLRSALERLALRSEELRKAKEPWFRRGMVAVAVGPTRVTWGGYEQLGLGDMVTISIFDGQFYQF